MPYVRQLLGFLALILGASFAWGFLASEPRPPCHVYNAVTRCYNVQIPDLENYLLDIEEEASHTLEITHSNLSVLSREPFHVKRNWEVLYMATNGIAEIEYDAFMKLEKVITINLERNLLTSLNPRTFTYCYLLVKLILSYNPLTLSDEESFLEANQLQYLDISFTDVKNLPLNTFKFLLKLRYLNISNNQLEVLDNEVFAPLLHLEVLDINNNNFKVIDYKVFSIHSLTHLYNDWVCDCNFKIVFYRIFENVTLAHDAVRCSENGTWTEMKALECSHYVPNKTLYNNLEEYWAATGVGKQISPIEETVIPPDILLVILSSVIVFLILILTLVLLCWCRTRNKVKINHPEEHSLDTSWQYGTVSLHRAGYDPGKGASAGTPTVSAPILQNSTIEGIPMTSIRPTAPRMADVYQRIDPGEHDVSYSDQEADDVALYERMH
ncbi:leucine-rich repeat-containing protein 15-like [Neodiprion pinetum]|uniref:leucine-rich repeat-containing protein 15-like n=1 Tax=Neodiprion pinetum TaxID=441929 RepID=UPI001EE0A5BB|nr:leucine-rich repeat-containing protein 15-like [Neodiprion pinetum]XP_046481707.1 leucine-rich repeat-containing protein 15-like [Neodiprion pinetum]XP_046481708.1 leucine-rich repeat-containing protein 15-like [Neodiprion pinetum]XP_046481709.1 leucine-rich repeat-containing protein 15-like [Neodiprion pinetum]XP_046481710.1 leucine-rich repeat-containing protein 15-like [Neodiprion pinetum]XP_046481711.1 leucine-rich repeat-containing protein 15-like [Neodiprion pinetum]XP_046481713.1 le